MHISILDIDGNNPSISSMGMLMGEVRYGHDLETFKRISIIQGYYSVSYKNIEYAIDEFRSIANSDIENCHIDNLGPYMREYLLKNSVEYGDDLIVIFNGMTVYPGLLVMLTSIFDSFNVEFASFPSIKALKNFNNTSDSLHVCKTQSNIFLDFYNTIQ
jgi:hypothetical protein